MNQPIGYEERLTMLKNFTEADPQNDMAHFSLGKLLLEGRDFAGAETALRRAIEINGDNVQARECLGQTLLDSGRRDEAVRALREGVLLAHGRREFAVRNSMQSLLRSLGVDPPDPVAEELARRGVPAGSFTCVRCGLSNPRLPAPPFDAPLGKKIGEAICISCWEEWMRFSVRLINEYRLNLATEDGGRIYDHHMKEFLVLPQDS